MSSPLVPLTGSSPLVLLRQAACSSHRVPHPNVAVLQDLSGYLDYRQSQSRLVVQTQFLFNFFTPFMSFGFDGWFPINQSVPLPLGFQIVFYCVNSSKSIII